MVGLLGPMPFFCSDTKVFTIRGVSRERASRFAEHAVIGSKPVLEYVGEDSDRVTFSIRFDSNLGIPPDIGLPMLAKLREGHKAWPLLIGPHYFGDYVIEYVSETHKYHNANGICLIAEATIDLRGTS